MEFDQRDVLEVIQNEYGLVPNRIERIGGYNCINFGFEVNVGNGRTKYIIKFQEGGALKEEMIKMQHIALRQLRAKDFVASFPIETIKKGTTAVCKLGETTYAFEVFTYLEGQNIYDTVQSAKQMPKVCYDVGKCLAQLHVALKGLIFKDLRHPNRRCWYADESHLVEKHIDYVEDETMKRILKKYIDSYRTRVLPRLSELRQGVVHGDATDTNFLVTSQNFGNGEVTYELSGVIDFEYCCYSYYVGCLGICLSYFLLKSVSLPNTNPIDNAKRLIQGYQSIFPLTSAEKELLLDFVLARISVSYIECRRRLKLNPENEEMFVMHPKYIPKLVDTVEGIGKDEIQNIWFSE